MSWMELRAMLDVIGIGIAFFLAAVVLTLVLVVQIMDWWTEWTDRKKVTK